MTDGDDLQQISDGADDLDGLLGAYVLDALDDDERERVEAYLATNPAARAEVDRLADSFDVVVAEDTPELAPPAELWDRLSVSLPPRPERRTDETPDPGARAAGDPGAGATMSAVPDELAVRREARPSRFGSNSTRIILSVAAAVIVVLVGVAVLRQSGSRTTSVAQQIRHDAEVAADAPGSKTTTLTGDSGASVKVVVDSSGRGYVTPENLPPLDEGSTYQLWSVDRGAPVSLGLLGSDPGVTLVAAGTDTTTMAITAEPSGGSPAPTSEIIVSGSFI
ncbi:MAG: anti-sigma factor [Acidimicrobiales bacterium]